MSPEGQKIYDVVVNVFKDRGITSWCDKRVGEYVDQIAAKRLTVKQVEKHARRAVRAHNNKNREYPVLAEPLVQALATA